MSYRACLAFACALAVALAPSFCAAQGSDPFAPTASQDPAVIDQVWQKGVSKYDAQRAKILEDVDKTNAAGPFRADWESLKTYQVPDWYRDAKFGIFIHWGAYSVIASTTLVEGVIGYHATTLTPPASAPSPAAELPSIKILPAVLSLRSTR